MDFSDTPIDVTRKRITGPLRNPLTPLGFQRLVVPRGPLSELSISAHAQAAGQELRVLHAVLEFWTRGQVRREEWRDGLRIPGPVDRQPVGLYLLLERSAERVIFKVRSGSREQTAQWVPRF